MDNNHNQTDGSKNTSEQEGRSRRSSLRRRSSVTADHHHNHQTPSSSKSTQRSTVVVDTSSSSKSNNKVVAAKTKWKVGAMIEARDSHMNWYKARIIHIDESNSRIKIHYQGWNSRYDTWFDADSDAVRPCDECGEKVVVESVSKDETKETEPVERIEIGARVLAKWIDNMFYPAVIGRHVLKNETLYYEVKFEDGLKKQIRFNNAKKLSEEEYVRIKAESFVPETPEKKAEDESKKIEETKKDVVDEVIKEVPVEGECNFFCVYIDEIKNLKKKKNFYFENFIF